MRRTTLIAAVAAACAGCGTVHYPWSGVPATPDDLMLTAQAVFRSFGIPVFDSYRGVHRLRSGPFRVRDTWDGDPVESRVDCGERGGKPLARLGPVLLEVELTAIPRDPFSGGDRVLPWTTLKVRGSGTLDAGDGGRRRCRLTDEFRRRLIRTIAAHVNGYRYRWVAERFGPPPWPRRAGGGAEGAQSGN